MRNKLICFLLSTAIIGSTFIGCGGSDNSSNIAQQKEQQENINKDKIYGIGDKVIVTDNNKDMYWLKIDSIKKANNFEYKDDFKTAKEIIEVTYSYGNLNKVDTPLLVHGGDLQVADANGTIADYSSMFPKGKPKELSKGTNCTVNAYYGLNNESTKVKIIFNSKQYDKQIVFEGDIK